MSRYQVCRLADLAEPGSYGFEMDIDGERVGVFVVRKANGLFAYRNSCPHTGAPLEWQPHHFLDLDNAFIQCAIHGALFRVSDGYCLRGPCAGDRLDPVQVQVEDGWVLVTPAVTM